MLHSYSCSVHSQAAIAPSWLYSICPRSCAPVGFSCFFECVHVCYYLCALFLSAVSVCSLLSLRSGCDCTNSYLLEHHLQVQLSHQLCLHQFLPVALGPVEETPVWTNTCTGSPLRRGRAVMLRDSRSGALTGLAHSSAESLVCFFHLGLEPRHRLFSQKP